MKEGEGEKKKSNRTPKKLEIDNARSGTEACGSISSSASSTLIELNSPILSGPKHLAPKTKIFSRHLCRQHRKKNVITDECLPRVITSVFASIRFEGKRITGVRNASFLELE